MLLNWISTHFRQYLVLAILSGLGFMLAVGELANHVLDSDREVDLAREAASYAATLESGTLSSRVMGALILSGSAEGRIPERPSGKPAGIARQLDLLTQLYFVEGAFQTNADGIVIATSASAEKWLDAALPFLQRTLQGAPGVYPAVKSWDDHDESAIFLAAPLRPDSHAANPAAGAIVVKLRQDRLFDLLKSWHGGPALLLSPQGVIFASSRQEWNLHLAGTVTPEQLHAIRQSGQFGHRLFLGDAPARIPLRTDVPEITLEGHHYTVRREPLEWNDPAGDWSIVLLDLRSSWLTRPPILWAMALAGAVAALFLAWLKLLADASSIQEMRRKDEHIRQLAYYDPLTSLPNRRMLVDRLQVALATIGRDDHLGALIFIDLDNFKQLNDSRGHDYGDLLLIQVATRLTGSLRGGDTVARLGGDEFVVMLPKLGKTRENAATDAVAISEKIRETLNQPYRLNEHSHHSSPSIGVTLFGDVAETVEDVMKRADVAMYQAKEAGRNAVRFFDPDMRQAALVRAELESALHEGMWQGQIVLYYQIQVDASGSSIGAEALVRWQHPKRGLVSPAEFIPLAERSGLIAPLGLVVLETAIHQLKRWQSMPAFAGMTLAVNVSPRQFQHPYFAEVLTHMIEQIDIDPRKLKIEITESLLIDHSERVIAKMKILEALGIRFAIDDFGTGYSSLSYLQHLPLSQLKIDGSFVRDMLNDAKNMAIVRTVISLAHSLELEVIAEGVETGEQRAALIANGCTAFQGYLFGKPVPITTFEESLTP